MAEEGESDEDFVYEPTEVCTKSSRIGRLAKNAKKVAGAAGKKAAAAAAGALATPPATAVPRETVTVGDVAEAS